MSIKCDFCNKEYTNKVILKTHQSTAKFCLKIQNKKIINQYKCELCNVEFNCKYNFKTHSASCHNNPISVGLLKKIEEQEYLHKYQINELTERNSFLVNQNISLESALENKRQDIYRLEKQIRNLENRIERIALRPTTSIQSYSNSNNNIVNNLIVAAPNVMKAYADKLTIQDIEGGAKKLAEFCSNNTLKNTYIVTDADKKQIKYNNGIEIVEGSIDPLRKMAFASFEDQQNILIKEKANIISRNITSEIVDTESGLQDMIDFSDICNEIKLGTTVDGNNKTDFIHKFEHHLVNPNYI
jgi:hypothetical protein